MLPNATVVAAGPGSPDKKRRNFGRDEMLASVVVLHDSAEGMAPNSGGSKGESRPRSMSTAGKSIEPHRRPALCCDISVLGGNDYNVAMTTMWR